MSLAKSNPKTFVDKMKTDEFKVTGLVYEPKKREDIYQDVDRAWYLQAETADGKKETRIRYTL